jgi:hypothetical protein
MLKKGLLVIVLLVFVGVLLFSYRFLRQELSKQRHPIEMVPLNALVLIESQNLKKSWSQLSTTNLVYAQLLNNPDFFEFDKRINKIDSLLLLDKSLQNLFDNNAAVLSLHRNTTANVDFLLVTRSTVDQWNSLRNLLSDRTEKVQEEKISSFSAINFTIIDTDNHYWVVYAPPLLAISASRELLDSGISQFESGTSLLDNKQFDNLRNYFNPSVALKVFIQQSSAASFINQFLSADNVINTSSSGWVGLGLTYKADAIVLSGYQQSNAAKVNLNKSSGVNGYRSLLPEGIKSFSQQFGNRANPLEGEISDYSTLIETLCDCDIETALSAWYGEELIEFSYYDNQVEPAVLLATKDEVNVIGQLTSFGVNEQDPVKVGAYYAFPFQSALLLNYLGVEKECAEKCNYFVQVGEYAVFSSIQGIKKIVATYENNLTTINENNFSSFQSKLLTPFAQSTTFKTTETFFTDWRHLLSPALHSQWDNWQNELSGWSAIAWQKSPLNDSLDYLSVVIQSNPGGEKQNNSTSPTAGENNLLWSIMLKNEVTRQPELIKNHQTNTFELVIQDVENVLHLLSPSGKVKWSRPLNEPIMGQVNQIDIFNNGKLQFVFNTATKIYCLDINGNNVKGYPIKLPSIAANQVSIMDYENKHEYRYLLATTDNKILNYDKEGLPIKGWDNKGTKSLVVNPIEHTVIEGKDYLYASDIEGNVYLWERKGPVRHNVGATFSAKNKNHIYLQRGLSLETTKIHYINENGQIAALNLMGKSDVTKIDSVKLSHLLATDFDGDKKLEYLVPVQNKFYVLNSEKKILFADVFEASIEGKVIITGKKNSYILVSNSAEGTVSIYNSHFEKLPAMNQPATHLSVIGDLNNDGRDNLITIVEGNKVMVYTLSSIYGL